MDIINIAPSFLGLVPMVIGLTQLVKTYRYIPSRYVPLFSLVLSIGGVALISDGTIAQNIFQGILVGLASIGLFNASRTIVQG